MFSLRVYAGLSLEPRSRNQDELFKKAFLWVIKLVFPWVLGCCEHRDIKSEAKLEGFSRYEGLEEDEDSELGQRQWTKIRKRSWKEARQVVKKHRGLSLATQTQQTEMRRSTEVWGAEQAHKRTAQKIRTRHFYYWGNTSSGLSFLPKCSWLEPWGSLERRLGRLFVKQVYLTDQKATRSAVSSSP